jgi:hypothetical protein
MKACFPKELSLLRRPEQIFCAMVERCKPYTTVLNKEHEASVLTLAENFLIVFITSGGSAGSDPCEKAMSVNLIGQKCGLQTVARSLSFRMLENCGDKGRTLLVVFCSCRSS